MLFNFFIELIATVYIKIIWHTDYENEMKYEFSNHINYFQI